MSALKDKALLVKLSISLPGNSRKDSKVTEDTIRRFSMGGKSGRWLRQIFPDEAYQPLVTLSGQIRDCHYSHSLPWTDEGYRIVPSTIYEEYCDEMRAWRGKYEAARDVFMVALESSVAWAKQAHNGTFDPTLYDPNKIERKFGLKLDFTPIPSGDDFRVTVDAEIRQELDERVQQAEAAAKADLWHRLAEPLRNMVERLGTDKAVFRDSLVSNLRDIVTLIPKLNLSADAQLAAFASQAQALAAGISAQQLRDDKTTRAETARKAADILSKMAGYMQ